MTVANLTCVRGDTTAWTIMTGLSLTGAKVWMTAQRSPGSPNVFQLTSPSGGIVPDADQVVNLGKAVFTLANSSTSSLPAETVVLNYDIQVLTASGVISTVQTGTLTVSPDVTTAVV